MIKPSIRILPLVALAVSACSMLLGQASQPVTVTRTGTIQLKGIDPNADDGYLGILPSPDVDISFSKPQISGTNSPARVPAAHVPRPDASILSSESIFGFNGLTHRDQRLAPTGVSTGINLSLTPPDQGLAVGNGYVIEAVNNAVAVHAATTGTRLALSALSAFFGVAPELDTATGLSGPFLSDPRVYYDWATQRFFLTETEIDTVPATGALAGASSILIAVSATSSPFGGWFLYKINTTNDATALLGPACPCFGDQPLIGADANAFYVSTNAFSIAQNTFGGTNVYALRKSDLISGAAPLGVRFAPLLQAPDTVAYSIFPASVPPGGAWAPNTEFFVSALDPNGTLDNRLTVWALTGTNSLTTATLSLSTVATEVYGQPASMEQKSGPTPLLDQLANGPSLFVNGLLYKNHLELIESNDDRMQQVVYAAGNLWTSLNTVVKPPNGPVRTGAAWFIINPSVSGGAVSGTVVNQGYLSVDQNNIAFPSIGVNALGKGVISASLIGDGFYPSAAYARLDAVHGVGPLVIAAAGAGPLDDFSGYAPFGFRAARWGDYSAAVGDENGDIWVATEYVPNAPRTVLTNWGSFISKVHP